MKKRVILNEKINTKKGITLISLVITVILLIILSAVSIVTLTRENGLLTKALTSKEKTNEATVKEKVELIVMASYDKNGNLNSKLLADNLCKEGIEGFQEELSFPQTVMMDDYNIRIEENGKVIVEAITSTPTTVNEAKKQKYIFKGNTVIQDEYGNNIRIPEGFKIASDSADIVIEGVVIEDVTTEPTTGSQFVWIPVGKNIYTNKEKTKSEEIVLGRYDFDSNGNPTAYVGGYKEESAKNIENLLNYGNTISKDVETFKTSVEKNGGYYIGRYEARTAIERKGKTDNSELGQVTVKGSENVYNYVTQPQATKISQEMYGEEKNFTSDLMNSYAWDTAIVFIQKFGQNNYSNQSSLNSGLAPTGTNNLEDSTKKDKVCNIWDMASNAYEWTTETSDKSTYPCVTRAGDYDSKNNYVAGRYFNYNTSAYDLYSFRVVLYVDTI